MAYDYYIAEWEGDSTQPFQNFTWKSRLYLFPKRLRFSHGRVVFEEGDLASHQALIDARNAVIERNNQKLAEGVVDAREASVGGGFSYEYYPLGGDALEDVPDLPIYIGDLSLTLRLYGDGVLVFTKELYSSKPFRLPGGFRAREWEIEVEGNVESVKSIELASSMRELVNEGGT